MSTKAKVILVSVGLLTAYAFGRYSAPEKVVKQKEVAENISRSEQTDTDIEKKKHKETTTTETTKPDGTKIKKTKVIEDTDTGKTQKKNDDSQISKKETDLVEVTKSSKRLTLSVLAGSSFPPSSIIYGGHATTTLIGPISVGLWGLTNGTGGASLGLNF